MKKNIIIAAFLILFFTSSGNLFSQEKSDQSSPQITVYGTLMGYGLFYGVGGELLLTRHIGISSSYTYISTRDENNYGLTFTAIPLHGTLYFGENHRFYIDGGATYYNMKYIKGITIQSFDSTKRIIVPSGGLGYNYCNKNGGFYFKTGPTLYITGRNIYFWLGITFGITF